MKRCLSLLAVLAGLLNVPVMLSAQSPSGAASGAKAKIADALGRLRANAESGDAASQYALGSKYRNGDRVPKDNLEAIKWYRKAADQGHALAQTNLGVMYEKGEGVPKDGAEAAK